LGILSKSKDKNPHFFCESCGAEVSRNARNCPECGSRFESVRCPACDFIGEEAAFKGGCPVCGYSSKQGTAPAPVNFPERKRLAGALPVWVYILTAAVFTAVLAALFIRILR